MKAKGRNTSVLSSASCEGASPSASYTDNFFSFGGFVYGQIWLVLFMLIILVL